MGEMGEVILVDNVSCDIIYRCNDVVDLSLSSSEKRVFLVSVRFKKRFCFVCSSVSLDSDIEYDK